MNICIRGGSGAFLLECWLLRFCVEACHDFVTFGVFFQGWFWGILPQNLHLVIWVG